MNFTYLDKTDPELSQMIRREINRQENKLEMIASENFTSQAVMDACDILLTTNEIYNTKARQLFIPMVPLTGTEGEIAELRAMYRLLCRYGKKGGVAYVTV